MVIIKEYHFTHNLINYDLIIGKDILLKLRIIHNLERLNHYSATGYNRYKGIKLYNQRVLCDKKRLPQNANKRVKHILDWEYKKIELTNIMISMN